MYEEWKIKLTKKKKKKKKLNSKISQDTLNAIQITLIIDQNFFVEQKKHFAQGEVGK